LKPDRKWNNGTPVTAADYVRAFQFVIDPAHKILSAELLKNLRHAHEILNGKLPPSQLGVRAVNPHLLELAFATQDNEFEYKLAAIALSPRPAPGYPPREQVTQTLSNGPYQIVEWKNGVRVHLTANPYFSTKDHRPRPDVEVLFIGDDEAALTLYEKKELSFLRRFLTTHIADFRTRPDLAEAPVSRFDYIGFGPQLADQPDLRKALALSLDFDELQTLLMSSGTPGCPSFPTEYMDQPTCLKMDLASAKEALLKVPASVLKQKLRVEYSALGGEDHRRVFAWAQAQWKKNLQLDIEIQAQEQGVFLAHLRSSSVPIFRKGVSLERPTCLAALETFAADSSENYIHFQNANYSNVLKKMALLPGLDRTQNLRYRQLCRRGVEQLIQDYRLIPLGHFKFSMLADRHFKGWQMNEMYQLDLSGLYYDTQP
jgi:oligopeptide transport system substrate-binding protein